MADKSKWVEGKVVALKQWTERLFSIQVDATLAPFQAGQFGKLALEINDEMVGRPYSFVNAPDERPLEFYFITVEAGPLSNELVALKPGDPLWLAPKASGFLVLAEIPPGENLWLLSTGTAIGPFLAICKTEEPWKRFSKIVFVHAVRTLAELTYQDQIKRIQEQHGDQFIYIPFVSREDTDFAIKGRVPETIRDGRLEARAGITLSAEKSQVMICGNPEMVSDTTTALIERGLKKNKRKDPGNISVENYW